LASCGMTTPAYQFSLGGTHIGSNCCSNKVSVYALDNNYTPSFSEFKAYSQPVFQVFNIPASIGIHSLSVLNLISTNVSPPGCFLVSDVSLPQICVFRI
jgi:hypothetical protein